MKKKIKGFTLIEVIVALALLGITSLVLVTMASAINLHLMSQEEMNDRFNEQQRFVEIESVYDGDPSGANAAFRIFADDSVAADYTAMYPGVSVNPNGTNDVFFKLERDTTVGNQDVNVDVIYEDCVVFDELDSDDGIVNATDDDDVKFNFYYFKAVS